MSESKENGMSNSQQTGNDPVEVSPALQCALSTLCQRAVPGDFLARATEAFEAARRWYLARVAAAVAPLALVVFAPLVWAVILNFKTVVVALADAFVVAASVARRWYEDDNKSAYEEI